MVFHPGLEHGLVVSEADMTRMQLVFSCQGVSEDQCMQRLTSGIPVKILSKNHHACVVPRISWRVLDSDLFKVGAHPMQLSKPQIDSFITGRSDVAEHVKGVVVSKLCTTQCVALEQRAGVPHSKAISALQYITRHDFKHEDARFNRRIKENLIDFIIDQYFSQQYLASVIAAQEIAVDQQVSNWSIGSMLEPYLTSLNFGRMSLGMVTLPTLHCLHHLCTDKSFLVFTPLWQCNTCKHRR